ncbi:MAG: hypothetical protein Q7T55_06260 [Solirubrobacteraceae bacterium]|nr:hypothetical protein [Solirubrobacteraceae bacterium]
MKDFLDGLDDRLRLIAEEQAAQLAPAPAPAARRARRRPALLAGLTGALATAGAVLAMNGVSFAGDLPILDTKSVDASGVATAAETARAAGVDFADAHTFPTVNGPGYVFKTPDGRVLCLSVPTVDGVYPGSCATRRRVEERGLRFEAAGDIGSETRSPIAFVLPSDAEGARVTGPGERDGRIQIVSGVVVGSIALPVEIRWTQDGRTRSVGFAGPFRPGAMADATCPDGRTIAIPLDVLRPAPSGRLDQDALRKACG